MHPDDPKASPSRAPGSFGRAGGTSVRVGAPGREAASVFGWRPPAAGGVLDEDDLPLAGARVRIGARRTRVAADGSYEVNGVGPGRRSVMVTVGPHRVAAATIEVRAGELVERRLTARGPRRVSGRVLDATRNGLGGATVRFVPVVRGSAFEGPSIDWHETLTHADGRFSFEIPGIDGALIARKAGHGARPIEWAGASSGLEVALPLPRGSASRAKVARVVRSGPARSGGRASTRTRSGTAATFCRSCWRWRRARSR